MSLNQYDKTNYLNNVEALLLLRSNNNKELPLIECVLKQMYQGCIMRVTKVADAPIFCDENENTSLFM